jgi:hypothetical protein
MKPLPTLMRPLRSVDLDTGEAGEALVDAATSPRKHLRSSRAAGVQPARALGKFGGDSLSDFISSPRPRGADPVAHALGRRRPDRLHGRWQDDRGRCSRASSVALRDRSRSKAAATLALFEEL